MRRACVTFPSGVCALVEVAETVEGRERGLAGRSYLPRDGGMLFLFGDRDLFHDFTTVGMRFSIDLIALRGGRIARIVERAAPGRERLRVVGDAVLEVRAGWCRERGVSVGQQVEVQML